MDFIIFNSLVFRYIPVKITLKMNKKLKSLGNCYPFKHSKNLVKLIFFFIFYVLIVMKSVVYNVRGLSERSVILFEWRIKVYLVPFVSSVFGVSVKTLLLMDTVMGTMIPLLVSRMISLFPVFIFSLKVTLIFSLRGTLTAFLTGFTLFTVGFWSNTKTYLG